MATAARPPHVPTVALVPQAARAQVRSNATLVGRAGRCSTRFRLKASRGTAAVPRSGPWGGNPPIPGCPVDPGMNSAVSCITLLQQLALKCEDFMTTTTVNLTRRTAANEHTQRRRSTARVLRSSNRFWRFTDFPDSSPSAAQHLLSELADRGELMRVRKGLYWRGVQTPLGMSPPPLEDLVRELVGSSGVGPAGLSASNMLRLSTQVPRRAHVAVPTRAPQSTGPVKFWSRPTRTARTKARLAPTEVALLETLDDWESVVEVPASEGWARLRKMLEVDGAMAERLALASSTEPGGVRARLAALLSAAGWRDLADQVPGVDPRTRATALRFLSE